MRPQRYPARRCPRAWEAALDTASRDAAALLLWERATEPLAPPLFTALSRRSPSRSRAAPRAGSRTAEIDEARSRGWHIVSLGPLALRTETVAAAVLGAVRVWEGSRVMPAYPKRGARLRAAPRPRRRAPRDRGAGCAAARPGSWCRCRAPGCPPARASDAIGTYLRRRAEPGLGRRPVEPASDRSAAATREQIDHLRTPRVAARHVLLEGLARPTIDARRASAASQYSS